MGRRLALRIATYHCQDAGLRRLTTRKRWPRCEAIGAFSRGRWRDDLTRLHFTGNGLEDANGRLYLAMTNTRRDGLLFTSLSADPPRRGCCHDRHHGRHGASVRRGRPDLTSAS